MRITILGYLPRICIVLSFMYLLYNQLTQEFTADCNHQPASFRDAEGALKDNRRYVVHEQQFEPLSITFKRNDSFDYKAAMQKLNDAKVAADDPRLIKLIRDYYIIPPSTQPYNLTNPDRLEYSNGQTPFIDSRLNYMEGGFYIECGALNGEKSSNTLFFEKVRKWNGLLVEADPSNFATLLTKNRKAFAINACLNIQPYPAMMTFKKAFQLGRIVDDSETQRSNINKDEVRVQCFPLYSLLLALDQLTVDFFSLDVEGDELKVLKTVPFDKVNIKTMTVEYAHTTGGYRGLITYVEQKGYDMVLQVSHWSGAVADLIFRKKGLSH